MGIKQCEMSLKIPGDYWKLCSFFYTNWIDCLADELQLCTSSSFSGFIYEELTSHLSSTWM